MKVDFQARGQLEQDITHNYLTIEVPSRVYETVKRIVTKPENDKIQIRIGDKHKPRSTGIYSQNAHLNGHIQQICEETGNDFQDVKMYVKSQALKMGYPFAENSKGEKITSMLTGEFIPQSESEASSAECAILIECVHILAGELGIILKETE